MTAGTAYSTTIYATNAVGSGSPSNAVSVTPVDQQMIALSNLYTATTGSGWSSQACPYATNSAERDMSPNVDNMNWWKTASTTFNSDGDYCSTTSVTDGTGTGSWSGVQCDADGYITHLSLYGLGLKGTLPTEIGYLTGLTQLNVGNNPNFQLITFTSSNHASIDGKDTTVATTCQLVEHALGSTQSIGLSGSLPTEIGKLTALTEFNAQYTHISGTIPAEFSSLSNLNSFQVNKADVYCYKSATTQSGLDAAACTQTTGFTSASDPFYTFLVAMKNDNSKTCDTDQQDGNTATVAAGGRLPCHT